MAMRTLISPFEPEILDQMAPDTLMLLQTAITNAAFRELCDRHIDMHLATISNLRLEDFEGDLSAFQRTYSQVQSLLDFWRGIRQLPQELMNRR